VVLFLALTFVATAIAAATAFIIFWPLALVHLRDRHPEVRPDVGEFAFLNPKALRWLATGRYLHVRDSGFTGLATPARIALLVIVGALTLAGLLWLVSILFPGFGG